MCVIRARPRHFVALGKLKFDLLSHPSLFMILKDRLRFDQVYPNTILRCVLKEFLFSHTGHEGISPQRDSALKDREENPQF